MHSKMILGIFVDELKSFKDSSSTSVSSSSKMKEDSKDSVGGWCYIGSHNFTPSAWGNLSGSAKNPILNVTNFELGILFPLTGENAELEGSSIVCWERPPIKYHNSDLPWMQDKFQ